METTFKVYAFTTSAFQLALLSLFVRMDYKLPNMVVGLITKDSIRNALKHGITSKEVCDFAVNSELTSIVNESFCEQICLYLEQYAHPQMRIGTVNPVPSNVVGLCSVCFILCAYSPLRSCAARQSKSSCGSASAIVSW